MARKTTKPIESLEDHGKMANMWRNHLGDSQKCVYLSTPYSEVPKMLLFAQFPLHFPAIHEDHHIPFIESDNANIPDDFSSPDVYFAEVLSTKIAFLHIFKNY